MKKIIFVQLPPPRFVFEDPGSNIPLAAGFLASCLKAQAESDVQIQILGSEITDVYGDSGIIHEVSRRAPAVLAMSLYLWNSQRSLFIASAVKRLLPDVKVIVGGPEVTPDNKWVLEHPAVDIAVFGEGEPQVAEVLDNLCTGLVRSNSPHPQLWDSSCFIYPYLDGTIGPSKSGSIFVETVRGCPFKCRYCFYHKAFDTVRTYPLKIVQRVLDFAYSGESGVEEIYLMDPTFNARYGFREILKIMVSKRSQKDVKIHTELRADLLNDSDIHLFREAGLVSAEIGLQSVNSNALKLAGRSGNPEKVLMRARELKDEGVDVTTGIILGLPGDNPDAFVETLNYLKNTGAFSVIQPFTLAVLPGTDFRRDSMSLGLKYDDRPPYYLRSSKSFSSSSMRDCLKEFERTFDMELDYLGFPSLVDSGDVASGSIERKIYLSKWVIELPFRNDVPKVRDITAVTTNPFTMWFKGDDAAKFGKFIVETVSEFASHNPHCVLNVIFEFDRLVSRKLMGKILSAAGNPNVYINKAFFPLYDEGEIISPNFLSIVKLPGTDYVRKKVLAHYLPFSTVVWKINKARFLVIDESILPVLLDENVSIGPSCMATISRRLQEKECSRLEEVMFRNSEDQDWWNHKILGLSQGSRLAESILLTR
ncbi:MAG: B12-binding domain-containing radical SAM protein [Desulfomonilaceae bacterium]